MKFSSRILMTIMILPLSIVCNAQIKNATTETVKIYGNSTMCEATIEQAGNLKNVSKVDWDKGTQMATLTYDSKKTNQDEILKKIALVGYDSDQFLAPDDIYASLPASCQYERTNKGALKMDNTVNGNIPSMEMPAAEIAAQGITEKPVEAMLEMEIPATELTESNSNTGKPSAETVVQKPATSKPQLEKTRPITARPATSQPPIKEQGINQLTSIFESYFALKDALVQTNGEVASAKAKSLLTAISTVKMEKLPMDVHMVWMKAMPIVKQNTTAMANSKEIETQRNQFINLSKNLYDLIKVAKYNAPVYYQFCPMANGGKGANWLSKESVVKNPYYGAQMLSCGKVVETIK